MVAVPINVKLAADTVAYILRDAGARWLFAEAAFRRLCPNDVQVIDFDHDFPSLLDAGPFAAMEPAPDTVAVQETVPLRVAPSAMLDTICIAWSDTGAAAAEVALEEPALLVAVTVDRNVRPTSPVLGV